MANKKEIETSAKVVLFAGEIPGEVCILLDHNSNMLELFFTCISELQNQHTQIATPDKNRDEVLLMNDYKKGRFEIRVILGQFGARWFYKVSIFNCSNKAVSFMAVYMNKHIEFYANDTTNEHTNN